MATYTENYGLHQWEGGDNFLRTDFNEDNAKIDAALGTLAANLGVGGKNARIAFGSYTGTGTYGENSKNSLTFDFTPLMVVVYPPTNSYTAGILLSGGAKAQFDNGYSIVSWSGKSVFWYSTTNAHYQFNSAATTYQYVAFGY